MAVASVSPLLYPVSMTKELRNSIANDVLHWFTNSQWAVYLNRLAKQRRKVRLNIFPGREIDAYPSEEAGVNVSQGLLAAYDGDEQEWVLIHELCHLMIPKDYDLHPYAHELIYDCMAWLWFNLLSIDTGKIISAMKKLPDKSDTWHCRPKDRLIILEIVTAQFPFVPVHKTY